MTGITISVLGLLLELSGLDWATPVSAEDSVHVSVLVICSVINLLLFLYQASLVGIVRA